MKKDIFILLVIVCITTHIVRATYEILKHKKMIKATKLSFLIVFTNMVLLWISWFGLCIFDAKRIYLTEMIHFLGIIMALIGVVAFFSGLFTIKSLESYNGDLITHGIYSKIRHPMYLGFILWIIGMPLYSGGLMSMILGTIFILNILFWRHLEEKELENRFPAYKEYRMKTLF